MGATAIEDKLQDNLTQTLRSIKSAGIRLWVLTGDKIETAVNIGFSCQLLDGEMNIYYLQETTNHEVKQKLDEIHTQIHGEDPSNAKAMIVAGDTLSVIE